MKEKVRLSGSKCIMLKSLIFNILLTAKVYIFGSRADMSAIGGDIDVQVVDDKNKLSLVEKINIKIEFWNHFGEQKIDIASFRSDSTAPFLKVALEKAVVL